MNPNDLEDAFAKAVGALLDGAENAADLLLHLKPVYLGDDRFKSAFAAKAVSRSAGKRLAKHILLSIEEQESGNAFSEESEKCTLEHIFPENPGDGWEEFNSRDGQHFVWRIGNLTLLDSKENQRRAGNKPFKEKIDVYNESRFKITQDCATYEEWSPKAINQRQERLAKIACEFGVFNFRLIDASLIHERLRIGALFNPIGQVYCSLALFLRAYRPGCWHFYTPRKAVIYGMPSARLGAWK